MYAAHESTFDTPRQADSALEAVPVEQDPRRVLLVAYHFGPGSQTGGIRWTAMTTALASRGWAFDVITLARPGLPTNNLRLHEGVEIAQRIRIHPIVRPSWHDTAFGVGVLLKRWLIRQLRAIAKLLAIRDSGPVDIKSVMGMMERSRYARFMANIDSMRLAFGDYLWSRRAFEKARELTARRRYRAVIVSSPPHETHLVGIKLSRRAGVSYLPDFRDPWTFGVADRAMISRFEGWFGPMIERQIFDEARIVICNTDWACRAVERAVCRPVRTVAVPNGADPLSESAQPDPDHFRVVFSGWLYPFMDPRPLLAACGRLQARSGLGPETFRVDFVGTDERFGLLSLTAMANSYGLTGCFSVRPRVSRLEALRVQQSAAVLVVFDCPHPLAVPMKFYDQSQMRGTMLLIGNPNGALADAGGRLGIRVYAPDDSDGIDGLLTLALERWRAGDYPAPLDREGVFDRRHAVNRMEQVLESIA